MTHYPFTLREWQLLFLEAALYTLMPTPLYTTPIRVRVRVRWYITTLAAITHVLFKIPTTYRRLFTENSYYGGGNISDRYLRCILM